MDEINTINNATFYNFYGGNGDDAELVLVFNGQEIGVSFFPSSKHPQMNPKSGQSQPCIKDHDSYYKAYRQGHPSKRRRKI